MPFQLYQYGSERQSGEGLRIGVARHLPRGIRRELWTPQGWFDTWLPLLAPSASLVRQYTKAEITFAAFKRHYLAEMKSPEPRQVIRLIAHLSAITPVSLGCFCEEESRCHRSLLARLIRKAAGEIRRRSSPSPAAEDSGEIERYASPVCLAAWADNELR